MIPSRKLTYPTEREKENHRQTCLGRKYASSMEGSFISHAMISLISDVLQNNIGFKGKTPTEAACHALVSGFRCMYGRTTSAMLYMDLKRSVSLAATFMDMVTAATITIPGFPAAAKTKSSFLCRAWRNDTSHVSCDSVLYIYINKYIYIYIHTYILFYNLYAPNIS